MTPRHARYPSDPAARRQDGQPYQQRLSPECRQRRAEAAKNRVTPSQVALLRDLARPEVLVEPVPGAGARRWQTRRRLEAKALRLVTVQTVRALQRKGWLSLQGAFTTGAAQLTDAGRQHLAHLEAELAERERMRAAVAAARGVQGEAKAA